MKENACINVKITNEWNEMGDYVIEVTSMKFEMILCNVMMMYMCI